MTDVIYQRGFWYVDDSDWIGVSDDGPCPYDIEIKRLTESSNRPHPVYDWPLQLAEKTWAAPSIEDFIGVYVWALRHFALKYGWEVDEPQLARSLADARREAVETMK